ncbi:hypothetical protein LQZ21_12480 [Treponema sp. TIM-1]|uniref:hypothetical protein n=1 Tax=Treponema sp. TIM-1 TaxID=2898417 RepID=UPI003980EB0C
MEKNEVIPSFCAYLPLGDFLMGSVTVGILRMTRKKRRVGGLPHAFLILHPSFFALFAFVVKFH